VRITACKIAEKQWWKTSVEGKNDKQLPYCIHAPETWRIAKGRATRSMNLVEKSSPRPPQKATGSSASRRKCAAPTWAICLRPSWLQVGLANSMLKHSPQSLMPKSEKYFMKLVRHHRAPEDTIISLAPCGVLRWLLPHMSLPHAGLCQFMVNVQIFRIPSSPTTYERH
jgi:hypothetical protein